MPYADVEGVRLYYRESGHGPALLLVHGWPASSFYWESVIPCLARHRRVVAVDLMGFGRSDKPDRPVYSMAAQADALARVLSGLGLERADVVGHSMGGMISLELACRHPALVDRLVLVAPAVHGPTALFGYLAAHRFTPLRWGLLAGARTRTLVRIVGRLFTEGRPLPIELVEDIGRVTYRSGFSSLDAMTRTDLTDRLPSIARPTLVVYGDRDRIVTPAQALLAHGRIHGARLTVLPGCGHCPGLEATEPFVRAVESFLVGEEVTLAAAG